jgi:hypothetical protein
MNNTFDNNFKKGCFAALGIPGISLAASFFALGALFNSKWDFTKYFNSSFFDECQIVSHDSKPCSSD